jgi:hypothetical protein
LPYPHFCRSNALRSFGSGDIRALGFLGFSFQNVRKLLRGYELRGLCQVVRLEKEVAFLLGDKEMATVIDGTEFIHVAVKERSADLPPSSGGFNREFGA